MTASNAVNWQKSRAGGTSAAHDTQHLEVGAARSLRPQVPMALRVSSGQAWVTLGAVAGGHSAHAEGDVFLHAGQTLWVAAGQHAVVEPMGGEPLQYRWRTSRAIKHEMQQAQGVAPWWRQAELGAGHCYAA